MIAIPQQPHAGEDFVPAMNVALSQADEAFIIRRTDRVRIPGSFTARYRLPVVFATASEFAAKLRSRAPSGGIVYCTWAPIVTAILLSHGSRHSREPACMRRLHVGG